MEGKYSDDIALGIQETIATKSDFLSKIPTLNDSPFAFGHFFLAALFLQKFVGCFFNFHYIDRPISLKTE